MRFIVQLVCVFTIAFQISYSQRQRLKEEFTWSRISYIWPTQSRFGYGYYSPSKPAGPNGGFVFPDSVETGSSNNNDNNEDVPANVNYIFENNIPMGANIWNNKLFITVPRRRNGVPSSLNYVDMNNAQRHNVPLTPYPNWDVNRLDYEGSERIVSVYRMAIDECDRAWMIDTGLIEIPGNNTRVQPAAILIVDLNTDAIIRRYVLPDNVLRPASIPAYIVVDTTSTTCDDAYAYIPDLAGYGLIVYSLKRNTAWRVNHNYFYLEPLRGEFNIGGIQFQWSDGIFSAGLSKIQDDGNRNLYFHSMAGSNLYSVSTRILKDRNLATRSYHGNDFKFLGDRGEFAQTSASALHQPTGILFFGLVNQNGLGCYNTNKPFKRENFVTLQKDSEKMIYPCDVKVAKDKIVLLTNNMPIFLYSKLDYTQTNFRIWISDVRNVAKGTTCA